MTESTKVCRACGTALFFTARTRGNGLCGPCTRAFCTHPDVERGDEFNPDRCRTCHAPVFPPALAPQPPPANPPRGEAVWPLVIEEAEEMERDPRVIALMRARDQQGRAKYGVPLSANDGRDTRMDAIQEALDLLVYLRKLKAEGGEVPHYWARNLIDMISALLPKEDAR